MRKIMFFALVVLLISSVAYAVPDLQLFINGATYDWHSETWRAYTGSFDLYVVSANHLENDVVVSMALAPNDNPANMTANFGGNQINPDQWHFGRAPFNDNFGHLAHNFLPNHGIYPTWFTEVHTGGYDMSSNVGDVMPNWRGNYWNPANGDGNAPARGQARMFHVDLGGTYSLAHFDAYTLNRFGQIDRFAPFSHDAESVSTLTPEPGTLALFGVGLLGLGGFWIRRRKA